ncbi:MAG: hypothetical protein EU542_08725, partial [Promethearchaeota archaeon]
MSLRLEDKLKEAKQKELNFNFEEATELYKEVLEFFKQQGNLENTARIYERIGNLNLKAVLAVETKDQHTEIIQNSINIFEKAIEIYRDLGNEVKELECRAGQFELEADKGISPDYCKKMYINSYKKYSEASDIYFERTDKENVLRMLSQEATILSYLLQFCDNQSEFDKYCQESEELIEKGWNLSDEIKNNEDLQEFLFLNNVIIGIKIWIKFSRKDNSDKEIPTKYIARCNEAINIIEKGDNNLAKAKMYFITGNLNGILAVQYVHEEEKSKYLGDKCIIDLERALTILKKLNHKPLLIHSIYWLDYYASLMGRYKYLQKRIMGDIKDIKKYGKIYENSSSFWGFLTYFLSANYYNDFARRSILGQAQRKTFAKKGIEELEEGLKMLPFGPFYSISYQLLTNLYSQLVLLETNKEEQQNLIEKMFEYAHAAENAANEYRGGMVRSAGYTSLYRAHRTLFHLSRNKEEKIKNLSAAIDAAKKNIPFSIESFRNYIASKMHLGLLYEDLAVLTKQREPLIEARDFFLNLVKEIENLDFQYFLAAAHEYLARIEERLGNHIASALQYELAVKAHEKSLKKVQFKPLRNRVIEKIEYNKAWKLIEEAKFNHKKEDHLKAKENYDKACEILEALSNYEYEASYYSSWGLLEISENASKNENHVEAIKNYKNTMIYFEKAKNKLKDVLEHSSHKLESERISKLIKVANVRINYCSARINLEQARILQKENDHLSAAENFALAASQFRDVCILYKIERERRELEAIYHLCRAWEGMELAENYQEPERFQEASKLFLKASDLFTESKLKLLASGNSSVCLALENGSKFDESTSFNKKAQYYKNIKSMLRNASSSYEKGGFVGGADWALATSTYFDALWNLIQADEELDLKKKNNQIVIGIEYLKSAAELFERTGYTERKEEIYEKIDRIKKEERILYSALNTISTPVISRSTTGIVAPACPIESSLSPKLSEINQLNLEVQRLSPASGSSSKYEIIHKNLLEEIPKNQRTKFRIGIAQIGLSKSGDIVDEFFEKNPSGLLRIKKDVIDFIKSSYIKMINKAKKNNVDLLIFPEMTIDLNYRDVFKELSDLAIDTGIYIIPGSYHDEKMNKNISIVFSPYGVLWQQEKHIP